ncbi:MAG: AAA family ATPase [Chitinophagales bacterium]
MKTITFYSYKGGVGRSLALSNVAIRLSEFKKSVCVIDFDLEAPGLHFKFKNYALQHPIKNGLVDYIHKFSCEKELPQSIADYSVKLLPSNHVFSPIQLIPAGNIENANYWKRLSEIRWHNLFYEGGDGIRFFLDMKAKIQKEFNPDFLLIDSRTGITDISGVTLRVLGDEVAILAANNDENIEGSIRIIKSLSDPNFKLFGRIPKLYFILTRIPFTGKNEDRLKEDNITKKVKTRIASATGMMFSDFLTIRSDRRLEEQERPLIGYESDGETEIISISKDYLKLFNALTSGSLSEEEKETFNKIRKADKLYVEAIQENDSAKKIDLLTKAIDLNPNKVDYYFLRGAIHLNRKDSPTALADFIAADKIQPGNAFIQFNLGLCNEQMGLNDVAMKYYEALIESTPSFLGGYVGKANILSAKNLLKEAIDVISKYIEANGAADGMALNHRADLYRRTGAYAAAHKDIQKAIIISPQVAIYFATLAEIFASENKMEEFYLNFSIALSLGLSLVELKSANDIYKKLKDDQKFIEILERYEVDSQELFS